MRIFFYCETILDRSRRIHYILLTICSELPLIKKSENKKGYNSTNLIMILILSNFYLKYKWKSRLTILKKKNCFSLNSV